MSGVLTLGVADSNGALIRVVPDSDVLLGGRVF
jgi:hypothetical protein